MTTNNLAEKTYRPFSEAFFGALVAAITEGSGSPWLVAAVPDAQSTPDESEPVRINLTLEGSVQGEFLLEFRRADAAMLAAKCLRQPPVNLERNNPKPCSNASKPDRVSSVPRLRRSTARSPASPRYLPSRRPTPRTLLK